MALFDLSSSSVGTVEVITTVNGGRPPEYFAQRVVDRLMYVGDNAPEPIREQALAFRDRMHAVILDGIKAAIESDRVYRK